MAILFFEGFDRSTVTKELDPNYWIFEPQQPVEYRKYAFGGYSYDHTIDNYTQYYDYYTPNNASLPTGTFQADQISPVSLSGNYYPGFGQPLGFLALHNLDITESSLLAPITYLQISGFTLPQSGQSFLSTRILGIETKDTNYADSDKAGRFGVKHPLVAFCSGNTTGLILNIVKTTGNHISLVENERMTIGLEVEQANGVSGTLDLNIAEDLNKYKLKSVFSSEVGYQSGDMGGRILTIDTDRDSASSSQYSPISRWCHFQFGIIETGTIPYIQVKLDDIDLLNIPADDSISNKDFWEDKIYISGFDYDNIRFFNRTYNGSIEYLATQDTVIANRYYERGAVTLIDDLILSDGSGTPNNFLGSNAKVVPFTPGINGNTANSGASPDGPLEWDTNSSSYRLALKNADGDTGKISASSPNAIAAIRYKNDNIDLGSNDPDSAWRLDVEDAIGGIKVYTQAKKEFLDSSYEIIMATGDVDGTWIDQVLLITNGDEDTNLVVDRTRKTSFSTIGEVNVNTDIIKFADHPSLEFNNSYIYTDDIKSLQAARILENTMNVVDDNIFTLESFVYFTGDQPVTLFSTALPTGYENPPSYLYSAYYEILCYTGWIDYDYYYQDSFRERVRLYFPENMNTGEWNHVALTRGAKENDNDQYTYPLIAFLNGISGTSFNRYSVIDWDQTISAAPFTDDSYSEYFRQYQYAPENNFISGMYTNVNNNLDLGSVSGIQDFSSNYGSITGSGLYSSPVTGLLSVYIGANQTVEAASFTSNYSGFLVLDIGTALEVGYFTAEYLTIEKNNTEQVLKTSIASDFTIDINTFLLPSFHKDQIATLNIPVVSGDSLSIKFTNTSLFQTGINSVYIQSASILDDNIPITNSLYYLPSGNIHVAPPSTYFYSHPLSAFGNFVQLYDLNWQADNQSTPFLTGPSFYGGNNLISDLRLTQGGIQVSLAWTTRYESNFVAPTDYFRSSDDNYVVLGESQLLTKTRYGSMNQFYEYNNPVTSQPWTTGLIAATGGILLGVRKL